MYRLGAGGPAGLRARLRLACTARPTGASGQRQVQHRRDVCAGPRRRQRPGGGLHLVFGGRYRQTPTPTCARSGAAVADAVEVADEAGPKSSRSRAAPGLLRRDVPRAKTATPSATRRGGADSAPPPTVQRWRCGRCGNGGNRRASRTRRRSCGRDRNSRAQTARRSARLGLLARPVLVGERHLALAPDRLAQDGRGRRRREVGGGAAGATTRPDVSASMRRGRGEERPGFWRGRGRRLARSRDRPG